MTVSLDKKGTTTNIRKSRMGLVEGYFDTQAGYWSKAYQKPELVNDFVLIDRKNIAVDFASTYLRPGSTVLDAGCGAGLTILDLVQRGFFVHGVDLSQEMIGLCRKNLTQQGIKQNDYLLTKRDVLNGDFSENSFDGILALGFLQYQKDELKSLHALHKLLKPGGILVLSGPVKIKLSQYFGLAKIYHAFRRRIIRTKFPQGASVLRQISTHGYGVGRFKTLLENSNFEFLDYKGHGFVHFAILQDLTSKGQHFLHRFFTQLSKFLPIGRFGNDMVVAARKKADL